MTGLEEVAENNDKAVLLGEEIDFLFGLIDEFGDEMETDVIVSITDRAEVLREAMRTDGSAVVTDEADEGTPLPEEAEDVDDDDHEFQMDRGGINGITCGESEGEHSAQ